MPLTSLEKPRYAAIRRSSEDLDELLDTGSTAPTAHVERIWRQRFHILLVTSLSAMLLEATLAITFSLRPVTCPSATPGATMPYSPAPVQYVNRYLTRDPMTPQFMGPPRPELDQAWHNLLEATMIRYTDEELRLAGNATSVRHKNGGYVGGLGVSHSLHCLKRLKQYIHPDYYYGHEEQDWDELYSHVDHCLESLRQTVLCTADVNVYTLKWTAHSRFKPTVKVPQAHTCVDWEVLHSWMQGRAARLDDMVGPPASLYEESSSE